MSLPLFIARRIYRNNGGEKGVSPPAVRVATVSMALGLAVILLSVSIVDGFKKEVRNKVIGFGSHIQISNFDSNNSYETHPICISDTLYGFLKIFPNITQIDRFATKPGMVKTEHDSQAMIFKGVDENYNWDFFQQNLLEGRIPNINPDSTSTEVLISRLFANSMNLKLNDSFIAYFINNENVRFRKFNISGIYGTGFADYDKIYILLDIKQIRRLNLWDSDMVSGLELRVKDYGQVDVTNEVLFSELHKRKDRQGNTFYTRSIRELNPSLFAWLDVLDINTLVIFVLMFLVAGFSMISGLLIIILERANMIGILKTLGQSSENIRKIFLYLAARIVGKALLWGNLIAITVCIVQKQTGVLHLNPDVYYLTEMPVEINLWYILLINLGVFAATLLALLLPSMLVARISPAKTIRFE
ncbi:MAG: ABC transporter permease [Dysgonamonadaceae bacterium]|nr:ABC transporter permease [Dysgonamonadaceae bacterium]